MRTLRYAFWGIVAICLVVIGIANRGLVELRALPDGLAAMVGVSPTISMPLFVVIFIGVALGLLIGFVWEWLREHRHRVTARTEARERRRLEHEVGRLRKKAAHEEGSDDILAIVDGTAARR